MFFFCFAGGVTVLQMSHSAVRSFAESPNLGRNFLMFPEMKFLSYSNPQIDGKGEITIRLVGIYLSIWG
jgi:hypothetical protein